MRLLGFFIVLTAVASLITLYISETNPEIVYVTAMLGGCLLKD